MLAPSLGSPTTTTPDSVSLVSSSRWSLALTLLPPVPAGPRRRRRSPVCAAAARPLGGGHTSAGTPSGSSRRVGLSSRSISREREARVAPHRDRDGATDWGSGLPRAAHVTPRDRRSASSILTRVGLLSSPTASPVSITAMAVSSSSPRTPRWPCGSGMRIWPG